MKAIFLHGKGIEGSLREFDSRGDVTKVELNFFGRKSVHNKDVWDAISIRDIDIGIAVYFGTDVVIVERHRSISIAIEYRIIDIFRYDNFIYVVSEFSIEKFDYDGVDCWKVFVSNSIVSCHVSADRAVVQFDDGASREFVLPDPMESTEGGHSDNS